jgi:DNA-binding NarL/FixJ family response regulator
MNNTFQKTLIAVAERHRLPRKGLCCLLEQQNRFEVVFDVADTATLMEQLTCTKPEVLLLDADLPPGSITGTVSAINASYPQVRIIILCPAQEADVAVQLLEHEVYGYISQNTSVEELLQAIQMAEHAQCYSSDIIKDLLVKQYTLKLKKNPQTSAIEFTGKEMDILRMMSEDMSTEEIALACYLSPRSIEVIRSKMKQKAGVKTLAALIHVAWQHNIFGQDDMTKAS